MMPPTPAITLEIMKTRMRIRGDVDAGAASRLGVASDRVDVPSEGRPLGEEREHDEEDHHEQAGERQRRAVRVIADRDDAEGRDATPASFGDDEPVRSGGPARRLPMNPPSTTRA